jgi:hypothetical protein
MTNEVDPINTSNQEKPAPGVTREIPLAVPIDEYGGLQLSIDLISSHRPELSPGEVMNLAIEHASSVTLLENHRAKTADIVHKVDSVFHTK